MIGDDNVTQESQEDIFERIMSEPSSDSAAVDDAKSEPVEPQVVDKGSDPAPAVAEQIVAQEAKSQEPQQKEQYVNITTNEFNQIKSIVGMVPNLKRELAQANKRLSELGNVRSATSATNDVVPQKSEASEMADELFQSDSFKTLKEEWPELAATFEKQQALTKKEVTALKSQIEKLASAGPTDVVSRIGEIEQRLIEKEWKSSVDSLTAEHPDWMQHVRLNPDGNFSYMSSEFAAFWWGLPEDLRADFDHSSLEDSKALMDDFKQHRQPSQVSADSNSSKQKTQRASELARSVAPNIRGITPHVAREDITKMLPEDQWVHVMKSQNPYV